MTFFTVCLRNGEFRNNRVVVGIGYSEFLSLPLPFPPRSLQLEVELPHTHNHSGRTEGWTVAWVASATNSCNNEVPLGGDHTFSSLVAWNGVVISSLHGMGTKMRISLIPNSSNNFKVFCRPGRNGLWGGVQKDVPHFRYLNSGSFIRSIKRATKGFEG